MKKTDVHVPILVTSKNLFILESLLKKASIPYVKKSSFSLLTSKRFLPSLEEISTTMKFPIYVESHRNLSSIQECSLMNATSDEDSYIKEYKRYIMLIPDSVAETIRQIYRRIQMKSEQDYGVSPSSQTYYLDAPVDYFTFSFHDGKNKYFYQLKFNRNFYKECPIDEIDAKLHAFISDVTSGFQNVSFQRSKLDISGDTFFIVVTEDLENQVASPLSSNQDTHMIVQRNLKVKRMPINSNTDSLFVYPKDSQELLYQVAVPNTESTELVFEKRLKRHLKYPTIRKIERVSSDTVIIYLS